MSITPSKKLFETQRTSTGHTSENWFRVVDPGARKITTIIEDDLLR